jgi:superfamily I DNA/RNA helicase
MPTILHDSQLTREQRAIVELRKTQHHLVMGPPGCGKTQVLLHRARWLCQTYGIPMDGFYVFVYTNVLTYFLRQSLEFLGIPADRVRCFDDWCSDLWDEFVQKPRPRTVPDRKGKSMVDYPAVRRRVLACLQTVGGLRADGKGSKKLLEFVLVDEGQDLDSAAYGILRLSTKHLTVFADTRQQIFEGGASITEIQENLSLTAQTATLLPAYRNSPDVAKLASYFGSAYEGVNYLAVERQKPCLYVAKDWEDEINQLAEVLKERRLLNHKCGIIVPTNRDLHSVANGLKARGVEVQKAVAVRRGGALPDFDSLVPMIASYHSAKGLTFDSVLLPKLVESNFKKVEGKRRQRLLLVGITRATRWVYLSAVSGWELREIEVLRRAASNGDLFIKEIGELSAHPAAAVKDTGSEEDVSFL